MVANVPHILYGGAQSVPVVKRRVEVSMRDLTTADREAFDRAKSKEWASWLDKEAEELVIGKLNIPRNHTLKARWVLTLKSVGGSKVPKARLCLLGPQFARAVGLLLRPISCSTSFPYCKMRHSQILSYV